jgi:hypothetical protein
LISLIPAYYIEQPFDAHTLDFEGHGTSPLKNRLLRLAHFAENVIRKKHLDSLDNSKKDMSVRDGNRFWKN